MPPGPSLAAKAGNLIKFIAKAYWILKKTIIDVLFNNLYLIICSFILFLFFTIMSLKLIKKFDLCTGIVAPNDVRSVVDKKELILL